jgi:6-phosphogluconolactonase
VHSANPSPDNRFLIVCDLGLDRIFSYALDTATSALTPAEPACVATRPGAGPRHFIFGPEGRHGYALNEIDATLVTYEYAATTGRLTPRSLVSTLPVGFTGAATGAELRLHPSGRWLYASNRGHDSLALFQVDPATGALTPIEWVAAGGCNPRHFTLTPDGAWLICCHQDSDTIGVFRIDPASGRLSAQPGPVHVSMPVCAVFHA